MQQVADLIPDLLFVLDLDDREIIYINNRVEQLLGYDALHVYAKGHAVFREALHPDDYERSMAHIEACKSLPENKEIEIEVRLKAADGSWNWYKIRDKAFKRASRGLVSQTICVAQNIQEQVNARETKNANEALLRQAEEVGKFGSYVADIADMQLHLSDGFYRLFGYDPKGFEPTLAFIDSVSQPDDAQKVRKVLEQARKDKQPYEYQRRIYLPNGQMRYLCSNGKVVCDASGNAVKLLGIVEDVTDKVRTDIILNTINEVCFELDTEFRFTYANRRAYQLWNKRPEQILGKNIWEVFSEQENTEIYHMLTNAAESGTQLLQEVYCHTINKWVFLNVNPSPSGLIILNFDVSEQVKTRKEIQESQEQFKTLVENIPDVVTRWDRNFRLLYANSALEAIIGLSNTMLYGKTIREMGQPTEIVSSWIEKLEQVVTTAKAVDHYFSSPTAKGANYYYSRLVPELAPDGSVQTVLAISRDITEQKKTQEALMEAERLSINGMLARTIAHEVRGPLVNINLALGLINDDPEIVSDIEKAQIYHKIIAKNSRRIEEFITELLSISNTQSATFVQVELADVVEEAIAMARDRLFLKSVKVEKHYASPCTISAEPDRLKIAVLNIIHNAIDAMEAEKGVLKLSILNHKDSLELLVQDNGCGMTKEQLNKMFDAYYTSKPSGLGVGLANVRSIISDHEAKIKVESETGKGTAFTVFFDKV